MQVQRDIHLLNGLLFDEIGDRLSPIHAGKAGKRYHYYISSRLKAGRSDQVDGWRIPASEIEVITLQQIRTLLADKPMLAGWMQEAGHAAACIEAGLARAEDAFRLLETIAASPKETHALIRTVIRRVGLASNHIRIAIDRSAIVNWLAGAASHPEATSDTNLHIVDLPLTIRQRGVERRLVIEGQSASLRRLDQPLIDMVARAHAYLEALTDGKGPGRKDVAKRFGVHPEDVSRMLPLTFMSPRIIESILAGQQPADLSVRHLVRNIELPIAWADQGRLLGI